MNGLFDLLPSIHRIRDAEAGGALEALLAVIEREATLVEDDIAGLYDNWFVETAAEWVVPYLGDLLGVAAPAGSGAGGLSARAFVANTIAYRRRKGTAAMLEQLARDLTGWPARAVEYFQLLGWQQHANHVLLRGHGTVDVRRADRLELLGGPFEDVAHTVDVRHIDAAPGRRRRPYNIPNVGLFLWRLQPYAVRDADARPLEGVRYTFNPLGQDQPLFNRPLTEGGITHLAEEANVPGVLRRRALWTELEQRRQTLVDGETPDPVFFGPNPVFAVRVDGEAEPIAPEEVLICHLGDWRMPKKTKSYVRSADGAIKPRRIKVAVDPVLGRLTFPKGVVPGRVQVSYAYGFSGDMGGGPYDRRDAIAGTPWRDPGAFRTGVSKAVTGAGVVATIADAIALWTAAPNADGVITILDSATYTEDLSTAQHAVAVAAGRRLWLVAADGTRPHLIGDLVVRGLPGATGEALGELALDGLLVEGSVTVGAGHLGRLHLSNCTLAPAWGGLAVQAANDLLAVGITRSIVGPVRLAPTVPDLAVVDSIVDGELGAPGAHADVQTSTVLGPAATRTLEAGNTIFVAPVLVDHRQIGCTRFCYVPPLSRTPRRFRCQPNGDNEARAVPQFTSGRFGDPGYGQLRESGPDEIAHGAEDEGEMGAFHFLQQRRRIESLEASLGEYLRFGLEAGILLVT